MSSISFSWAAPHVGNLTIKRADKLNALDTSLLLELRQRLTELRAEPTLRVLIVSTEGDRAFVAGGDIKAMRAMRTIDAQEFARLGHATFDALASLHVPVIAEVQALALGGGCELILACDLVVSSTKAKFGQPEVKLGVIPGFGGTQRLPRKIGWTRAFELLTVGEPIDAATALSYGLVNRVVSPEQLKHETLEMANAIAARSPNAIRILKRTLQEGLDLSLTEACRLEAQRFADCFDHPDQAEGMIAFVEKRAPRFVD